MAKMTLVIMVWIMQVMMYMLMMFLMNNLVMMRSKRMMLMTMLQIAASPEERMDWCGSWCWCLCRWWIILWWCVDKDDVYLSHTMNNIVMMLICLTRRGDGYVDHDKYCDNAIDKADADLSHQKRGVPWANSAAYLAMFLAIRAITLSWSW